MEVILGSGSNDSSKAWVSLDSMNLEATNRKFPFLKKKTYHGPSEWGGEVSGANICHFVAFGSVF